jgi:hypothetical protein
MEETMTATALAKPATPLRAVFDRYHVGWETRNPDLIASLHSEDTVFHIHDGSAAVHGREALRQSCIETFRKFDFSFETVRWLDGGDHWVFEWIMVLALKEPGGAPFTARVGMLDVVTVNARGEVTHKDVYMNGGEAQAAFARAGIQR